MIDLNGAIDIHVHAGPEIFTRIGSVIDIARRACDRGMAGLALKSHHEPSVTRAVLAKQVVPLIELWGGITLNAFVGGINPIAVASALDLGGRIVWMPTMHAQNHINILGAGTYGIPTMTLVKGTVPTKGITILDEKGALTPETETIVDLVVSYNAAIATSHLSEREIRTLLNRCREKGARCVISHAFFPKHSPEFLAEMAALGAIIEISAVVTYPMARHLAGGMSLAQARDLIKAVGAKKVVISSDSGQIHNPWPADILQSFLVSLNAVGISEAEIREMVIARPREVLGL